MWLKPPLVGIGIGLTLINRSWAFRGHGIETVPDFRGLISIRIISFFQVMEKLAAFILLIFTVSCCFLAVCSVSFMRTHAGLVVVPSSDIPDDATEVNLESNNIGNITHDPFTHLRALETLRLGFNDLTAIPSIKSTSNTLKWLYLNGNRITVLPEDAFADFSVLKYLRLSGNLIQEMEVGSLNGMTALKQLFLDGNDFNLFDNRMSAKNDLINLHRFVARNSKLIEFPCLGPYNTNKLKLIYVENCEISAVRRECVEDLGPGPFDIELQGNRLTSLANLSQVIATIRSLDVSDNEFLGDLPLVNYSNIHQNKLEILNISRTLFPVLPLIQPRLSLLELHASAARIMCVPTTRISALSHLQILDLSSNRIKSFPDDSCTDTSGDIAVLVASGLNSTTDFNNLKVLNLENNMIQNFPSSIRAIHLIILKLSYNQITEVSHENVASFSALKSLELSHNMIVAFLVGSMIPSNFMAHVLNLDLRNNRLDAIPDFSSSSAHIYLMENELVGFLNRSRVHQKVGWLRPTEQTKTPCSESLKWTRWYATVIFRHELIYKNSDQKRANIYVISIL